MAQPQRPINEVLSSYNMFLNSDDGVQNGQDCDFQFGNSPIVASNGEFIRVSVNNFSMYKTWTDVNAFNQDLVLRTNGGTTNSVISLAAQNYDSIASLAAELASVVTIAVNAVPAFAAAAWTPVTVSAVLPPPTAGITGTTNNVISFLLTTAGGNAHGFVAADANNGNFGIQASVDPVTAPVSLGVIDPAAGGDVGQLLGVDRVFANTTNSSFNITFPSATTIQVTARYPAQRSTEANMYLRINPAPHVVATENFNQPFSATTSAKVNPSQILAEMRIDSEFVQYSPQSGREYFADFHQKHLSHIKLTLTDSHYRLFPLLGVNQATTGNRNFTCTLRVDVVAGGAVSGGGLEIVRPSPIPKHLNSKDEHVLVYQKNGRDMYGKPMGF